jgi:hypothetical protein
LGGWHENPRRSHWPDLSAPIFSGFLNDQAAFRKVKVADFGGGAQWDNGFDYSADTAQDDGRRTTPDDRSRSGGM